MLDNNTSRLLLHVGLPRTGTTTLQRHVFPAMTKTLYLGKPWNNKVIGFDSSPLMLLKAIQQHKKLFDKDANIKEILQNTLFSIINNFAKSSYTKDRKQLLHIIKEFCLCIDEMLSWQNLNLLHSNEALIESLSGTLALEGCKGLSVPLEFIAELGLLKRCIVSLVLREPLSFLRASFYKSQEMRLRNGIHALSFESFIQRQIAIFLRQPSASRIFLCMHKPFITHMKKYCPHLVVNHYENLIEESHVLDALFGFKTGEKAINMKYLPGENKSNRNDETVRFILAAPGVPHGISIEEYTESFAETLDRYELNSIFMETTLRAQNPESVAVK